jgi:hypothetical protein
VTSGAKKKRFDVSIGYKFNRLNQFKKPKPSGNRNFFKGIQY